MRYLRGGLLARRVTSVAIDAPGGRPPWAKTKGEDRMRTRIRELPAPAMAAGGLAVLGGVTLHRLGIEFERAWLRSYEGPLLGESPAEHGELAGNAGAARTAVSGGRRRRWVSAHEPRIAPRAPRASRSRSR
jgi:hypothetical protein